ncbi:MAG: hypothetical protein BJ554DRAFT_4780, partial [Olpidium bornovanus]
APAPGRAGGRGATNGARLQRRRRRGSSPPVNGLTSRFTGTARTFRRSGACWSAARTTDTCGCARRPREIKKRRKGNDRLISLWPAMRSGVGQTRR